jgi:hypothetical protein
MARSVFNRLVWPIVSVIGNNVGPSGRNIDNQGTDAMTDGS